eukprot:1824581-Rhodomonas_salina.1
MSRDTRSCWCALLLDALEPLAGTKLAKSGRNYPNLSYTAGFGVLREAMHVPGAARVGASKPPSPSPPPPLVLPGSIPFLAFCTAMWSYCT